MNEVWNLNVIYQGFEDPQYEADLGKLKERASAYAAYTAALGEKAPAQALKDCILLEEEIVTLILTVPI